MKYKSRNALKVPDHSYNSILILGKKERNENCIESMFSTEKAVHLAHNKKCCPLEKRQRVSGRL